MTDRMKCFHKYCNLTAIIPFAVFGTIMFLIKPIRTMINDPPSASFYVTIYCWVLGLLIFWAFMIGIYIVPIKEMERNANRGLLGEAAPPIDTEVSDETEETDEAEAMV